ncbi:hypothetical protein Acr_09g0001690 [Actinidia rufa]|uniref:Uncharacterized protein n=1 Tax=Actinidia rufa TaxID=165716 RepID=A0A7J0F548_9ERIC|nr:hypothetical protein Acr_09g0001690 [Actinidia rufa]
MSGNANVGDLENSIPSWIFEDLGEKSYMSAEVTQLSSFPREDPPSLEDSPLVDTRPSLERVTNTMTQGELDCLRESCSISAVIQIRLPGVDKTIMSTRSSKIAFYEAAFKAGFGLRLPIRSTIRRILHYYNICPT